jgi:hypothetical protein
MIAGGETYASRPAVVPLEDGEPACQEFEEESFLNETMPPLDDLAAEDADITRNDDGSVHAVMDDPEEGRFEVDIDGKGRVRGITAQPPAGEDMDMTMVMAFEYGERSTIDTPSDYKLLPASVEFEQDWEDAAQTWTVVESREEPPLGDFEVRIQDYSYDFDQDSDPGASRAVFELQDGESQADGNLTFEFTDADDDGKLSAGDSFVVTDLDADPSDDGEPYPPPAPEEPPEPCDPEDPPGSCDYDYSDYEGDYGFGSGFSSYQVVVYDRVADGEVNSGLSSIPSPLWLSLAALGLAGLAARRRR